MVANLGWWCDLRHESGFKTEAMTAMTAEQMRQLTEMMKDAVQTAFEGSAVNNAMGGGKAKGKGAPGHQQYWIPNVSEAFHMGEICAKNHNLGSSLAVQISRTIWPCFSNVPCVR